MLNVIVGGIVLLLVLLAGWTWRRGAKARAALAARYPPIGKLVDVDGYRLHLNCQGQGSPTVVIEAGNADCSLSWGPVQRGVARFTRICTYDRAGLGWSERSPQPRSAHDIVEGLHTLLARSGVEPPYVLVGHSLGGPLVRLYAHEHPDQVVGVVLVDAAHEEMLLRYPEAVRRLQPRTDRMMAWLLRLAQMLAASGAFALAPRLYPRQFLSFMPEEARATYLGIISADARCLEAIREEYATYQNHLDAVRAAHITSLDDIPLTVLSHGQPQQVPALSREVNREFERTWQQMQVEQAAQSSRGKRIVAEKSGHYIQLDQPELVIDAIHEVVEAARCR